MSYQSTKHKRTATASTRHAEDTLERVQLPEQVIREFYSRLCAQLDERFEYAQRMSIVVLQVSQQEIVRSIPHTDCLYERHYYHVPGGLLEQILTYVRRSIRMNDKMIVYEDAGAALVLPDTNDLSTQQILERIYSNLRLLQAETLLPPLTRETHIQLGSGNYSIAKTSLKVFQYSIESKARYLILRPALSSQQEYQHLANPYEFSPRQYHKREHLHTELSNVPFMQLPTILPSSVKQFIPHTIACELHCAPIGREHKHLTVAMQDPTNIENVRHLQNITGMTIFPVACEEKALTSLLATDW